MEEVRRDANAVVRSPTPQTGEMSKTPSSLRYHPPRRIAPAGFLYWPLSRVETNRRRLRDDAMTEAEWAASDNAQMILGLLRGKASDRKLRLFACACCRGCWPSLE